MNALLRGRDGALALIANPVRRRQGYALLALLLALLCFFPQPFKARAKLLPQDSNAIGIGSLLSSANTQLGGLASLIGGTKQPIDFYLAVGRGAEVSDDVIRRLKLVGPDARYPTHRKARLALARKVDIHSLTGGVLEIEAKTHDPQEAQAITAAYVAAISSRLNILSRQRVDRKQQIVRDRFKEAADRVTKTEAALNAFRRRNSLAEPEAQLGAAISLRAGLEARLQAKQIELRTAEQFQGSENPQLQALRTEVAALRAQIARTVEPGQGAAGPNVAGLSEISGEYLDRYRDYRFAQALYEVYSRSSEEVAVETLGAEANADVQVVEAPNVDVARQYNVPAVALLVLVLLAAFFTEIYAPATGMEFARLRRNDSQ